MSDLVGEREHVEMLRADARNVAAEFIAGARARVTAGLTLPDECRATISHLANLATYGRGIWVSVNNGESWYEVNQGMVTDRSFSFVVLDGTIFVGTAGDGVCVLRNPVL